ncbi:MAG: HEAT repeat domain-containing protein [Chloroflexi bacterium]|nr:HEAT repeat domain-containing protein [Chloroflexota bacterium]
MNDHPSSEQAMIQEMIDLVTDLSVSEGERIDACHKLGQVSDPAVIDALIAALEDPVFAVRWAAAEALVRHGSRAIEALLYTLSLQQQGQFLYEGAHHVLKQTLGYVPSSIIKPVIEALEGSGAAVATPIAAQEALNALKKHKESSS